MSLCPFETVRPALGATVYVADSASVIGRVTLADDASVWPRCILRGDVNSIAIGARSNVQDGTIIHVAHDGPYSPGGLASAIGADVTVGHGCIVHGCSVGDRCLLGMGSIVMDGAIIENDVMVAAGSLVSPRKQLRAGQLYRGRPARPVRPLTNRERDMLGYSAAHYVRLKNRYLEEPR